MNTVESGAHVNGVKIVEPSESLTDKELRQRACGELLRQAAISSGLLDAEDPEPTAGVMSSAASDAVEKLLDGELPSAQPDDETCRRFFDGNINRFSTGERVKARHVLFAVIPGIEVAALRKRAEACLIDLRCDTENLGDRFGRVARTTSNCPTGADGGELGWLTTTDCAPEFAREIFGNPEIGVLPRLIPTRFGLHVVEVTERQPGVNPTYEQVQSAVMQTLQRQHFATALRQYLQLLAGQADMAGIDLERSDSALVQ